MREIERQLRMPQATVSKHLRVLREAGFVESTGTHSAVSTDSNLSDFRSGVPGWLRSADSGPLT